MTAQAEPFCTGGFIHREAPGMASRETAVQPNVSGAAQLQAPAGLIVAALQASVVAMLGLHGIEFRAI